MSTGLGGGAGFAKGGGEGGGQMKKKVGGCSYARVRWRVVMLRKEESERAVSDKGRQGRKGKVRKNPFRPRKSR